MIFNKIQDEDRNPNTPVSYKTSTRFLFTSSGWVFTSLTFMKIRILLNEMLGIENIVTCEEFFYVLKINFKWKKITFK